MSSRQASPPKPAFQPHTRTLTRRARCQVRLRRDAPPPPPHLVIAWWRRCCLVALPGVHQLSSPSSCATSVQCSSGLWGVDSLGLEQGYRVLGNLVPCTFSVDSSSEVPQGLALAVELLVELRRISVVVLTRCAAFWVGYFGPRSSHGVGDRVKGLWRWDWR